MSPAATGRGGTDFAASASDGSRLVGTVFPAVADGGEAGAAASRLVLVHPLAMDRTFWRSIIDRLPPGVGVVAYDCRGHGASVPSAGAPPGDGYAIETFGHDLAAVLDHVGWADAVVAGASMGGCAALSFAALYPKRTRGLGLFDTTAWYGEGAPQAWAGRAEKALAEGLGSLLDFQKTRWFTDRFHQERPDIVQACIDTFLRNDLSCYAATCRMLGAVDLRSRLDGLTMPAEIIVGEEDYATPPPMAEALATALPQARLRVIPAARHFTPVEAVDVTVEVLGTLVERAAKAGGRP